MSGVSPTILGLTTAVGGAHAAIDKANGALLPFTGLAFGIYVAVAAGLILAGVFMRRLGSKEAGR